ncbi:hypothetical protein ACSBR2_012790 [Camellia fascicularis]
MVVISTPPPIFFPTFSRTKHPLLPISTTLPPVASAAKSLIQTLRRYMKKPWEITGSCVYTEYMDAVPKATEYRFFCPATVPVKAIIPTSDPETVYDIKYFSRDQRRTALRFDEQS